MTTPSVTSGSQAKANPFFRLIRSPFKVRLFLLSSLPSAFFSGLRIPESDEQHCVVTVRYRWFTKNPFRSTYFACLGMAAEMSTGVLAMAQLYKRKPRVSMLVVQAESAYFKKAVGTTRFLCTDGAAIKAAVDQAIATGEATTIKAHSIGTNAAGETVAEFFITWSFKVVGAKRTS